ncbi:LLM class oxidoreductase [Paraburkholderia phosphatilytica]|uniref:LLM class oxidoreductase n=1 Tax=Paraburkholderia phosphatilytica TaxID=2282883 RepID=UPI000E554D1E|nr:LLM class oxidoreductase [Paraburkholderia phosphatilytica]
MSQAFENEVELEAAPNRGFRDVFKPGELTLGFILPLEGYPLTAAPTMHNHGELAELADRLGFAALWARDVPMHDPGFGDTGQTFEAFSYLAFLAAKTQRIALGTASTVIPFRHPVLLGKAAATVDQLSEGRLILGVASGDRPAEYPAFGIEADYETRGERFREAFQMFNALTQQSFPVAASSRFGTLSGQLDLVPKPTNRIPLLVTGRSQQALDWIARHSDGWLYYYVNVERVQPLVTMWRDEVAKLYGAEVFKPYAQGMFFDLAADPNCPIVPIHAGLRMGRNALIQYLETLGAAGVNHVAFNLKPSHRSAKSVMEELAEYVLPALADKASIAAPPLLPRRHPAR